MIEKAKEILKTIKKIPWKEAEVSFYVVRRKLVSRSATYLSKQVGIHQTLEKKLRKLVYEKINDSNEVREYDFNTADLNDGELLTIPLEENDLLQILEALQGTKKVPFAASKDDLVGSWMYIVRLDLDVENQSPLFFARKVSATWQAKNVSSWRMNLVWKDNMLVDLGETVVLPIDKKVDFFSYDGMVFILHKVNFETALNFRDGMKRNRDEVVQEFETLGIFDKASEVSRLVGDNLRHLRKLSQVKKAGYYCQEKYMKRLREVNDQEGWGLEYTPDGKIMVTERNIKDVLTYLNNDRLISLINSEVYDVDVKRKIG